MSADNFAYVRKHDGKYWVTMEFASDDNYEDRVPDPERAKTFDNPLDAMLYAHEWENREYFEYGVNVSEEVLRDLKEYGGE